MPARAASVLCCCVLFVAAAAAARAEGQRFALVIGIKGYEKYPEGKKLNFSDADAVNFAEFIKTDAGGGFPQENIRLLTNKDATREGIYRELGWLSGRVQSGDLLYVYFAGHGKDDSLGRAYFMPFDADPNLPAGLGIRADQFLEDVKNAVNPKIMLFFIDACHAGAALAAGGAAKGEPEDFTRQIKEKWASVFDRPDTLIMAFLSAGSDQSSWEDAELRQSLFTHYLLKGMGGAADTDGNGVVTAREVQRYVLEEVEAAARRKGFKPQSPTVSPRFEPGYPLALLGAASAAAAGTTRVSERMQALLEKFITLSGTDRPAAYRAAKDFLKEVADPRTEVAAYLAAWVADYEKGATPEQSKFRLYDLWHDNYNKDAERQKAAYKYGKELLDKHGADADDYVLAVLRWVNRYEKAVFVYEWTRAIQAKNFAEAFRLGRWMLAKRPDDLPTLLAIAATVSNAHSANEAAKINQTEAGSYVRRAIALIEGGEAIADWTPFASRDQALGILYLLRGLQTVDSDPAVAAESFVKALRVSELQNYPGSYVHLARAYSLAYLEPLRREYDSCLGKGAGTDCQDTFARTKRAVGAVADALARAVAVAGDKPEHRATKAAALEQLTELYKYLNDGSTAGLDAHIADAARRPLELFRNN